MTSLLQNIMIIIEKSNSGFGCNERTGKVGTVYRHKLKLTESIEQNILGLDVTVGHTPFVQVLLQMDSV